MKVVWSEGLNYNANLVSDAQGRINYKSSNLITKVKLTCLFISRISLTLLINNGIYIINLEYGN
jgi:hypothetical protein